MNQYTETQRMRNRKLQEADRRDAKLLWWLFVAECVGFAFAIVIEVCK